MKAYVLRWISWIGGKVLSFETRWGSYTVMTCMTLVPPITYLYVELSSCPLTVTTRNSRFLVGDPYKPSFVTVTGRGVNPTYMASMVLWVTNDFKVFAKADVAMRQDMKSPAWVKHNDILCYGTRSIILGLKAITSMHSCDRRWKTYLYVTMYMCNVDMLAIQNGRPPKSPWSKLTVNCTIYHSFFGEPGPRIR